MKIAICIPVDLNYHGGVEKHVLRLADAMRRLGLDVDVFGNLPSKENTDKSEQFESLKHFKPAGYDIIHTHAAFYTPQLFALQIKGKKGRKHVHTLHSTSLDYLFSCRAWLNWRCYYCSLTEAIWSRYADHVIAVSQTTKDWAARWFRVPEKKITVIPNGHTPLSLPPDTRQKTRTRLDFNNDDLVVLFVGRGEDRVKGADIVFNSIKELSHRFPNLKLLAAPGSGFPKAPWLISTGIIPHKQMPEYYTAADIFVNASLSEGMPLTIVEAMAAPLPIIAAPVGGICDVITHQQNGLLLNNERSNLTELLEKLITNSTTRHTLAQNSSISARELTWKNLAQKTAKIYQSLLNE